MPAKKEKYPEEVVTVTLKMSPHYVTCITCDLCYACGDEKKLPVFCQKSCHPIDPRDVWGNMKKAENCEDYWPYQINRVAKVSQ